jgi:hypothetical protein
MHGPAGGVGPELSKCYLLPFGKAIGRDLPSLEVLVHIGVEVEFSLLHQAEDGHGGYRFADGRGLEKRARRDRRATNADDAEAARPFDFAAMDYRDADPWNVQSGHAISQFRRLDRFAPYQDLRQDSALDALNPLFHAGRSLSGQRAENWNENSSAG